MFRKIIFGTTAFLCSQLTEAAERKQTNENSADHLLIFFYLIPFVAIAAALERNRVLPIWAHLYYRMCDDQTLADKFFKDEEKPDIQRFRADLNDLRQCEDQLERRREPQELDFDARMEEFDRFQRQKYAKFYEYYDSLQYEKEKQVKKPHKPNKKERAKLRAKKFFDVAAANSSSEALETKRNTLS